MGSYVQVLRPASHSGGNKPSDKVELICVVNTKGDATPLTSAPAYRLIAHPNLGDLPLLEPVDMPKDMRGPMAGGNYALGDDLFANAVAKITGPTSCRFLPVPIHDHFEALG